MSLLRLDLTGGLAPGNKACKLESYLALARERKISRLLSFGGGWSNHLHALAALGAQQGFETVGIVRGGEKLTPTLEDAQRWGMQLEPISRSDYRRRSDTDFLFDLEKRFGPCMVIPEGAAGVPGASGCAEIARMIARSCSHARHVMLPVGTGTTLAGLVAALAPSYQVSGISALKGAADLEQRVQDMLSSMRATNDVQWQILHDFHCGGFARVSVQLQEFMLEFERVQGVLLDPVYTAKTLYALHHLRGSGVWAADEPVLMVHTGGLQGRRGYSWLDR